MDSKNTKEQSVGIHLAPGAEALGPVPEVQDPIVPLHAWWPDEASDTTNGWMVRARQLAEEAKHSDPTLVFIGDSITQAWAQEGRADWDARFAPYGAINLGIGGDRAQQLLYRIERLGTLDGLSPRLIVLLAGVNNLWNDVHTYGVERVSEGIRRVVNAIRERCPESRLLVLGILPTQWKPEHPLREIVRQVNALSAFVLPTADGAVRFADIGDMLLLPDGTMAPELTTDACHLTPEGYRVFAEAIEPMIREMI